MIEMINTPVMSLFKFQRTFSTKYQICQMRNLLSLYEQSEVRCFDFVDEADSTRRQCLVEAGICDLYEADFIFEITNNFFSGYPFMTPSMWEYRPLKKMPFQVSIEYFRHARIFQNQVA